MKISKDEYNRIIILGKIFYDFEKNNNIRFLLPEYHILENHEKSIENIILINKVDRIAYKNKESKIKIIEI